MYNVYFRFSPSKVKYFCYNTWVVFSKQKYRSSNPAARCSCNALDFYSGGAELPTVFAEGFVFFLGLSRRTS